MNVKQFYLDTGSNYQAALSIMMVDSLIERMINKFMSENVCNDIIDAYNRKDIKRVFELSHSFKGVTGNLALTGLFEISSVITEATRNKTEANIDNEIEQLKKTYTAIQEAFNKLQ